MIHAINLDPDAPCPCGRHAKPLARCCLRGKRFLPLSVGKIAPLGSFKHDKCYASELGGCSSKISLEHYISATALQVVTDNGDFVVLESPSFARRIPARVAGAKILCTSHNRALSPLDVVGTSFFSAIHNVGRTLKAQSTAANSHVIGVNGHDVERWLLKILIGVALSVLEETKKKWTPPRNWLRVLYGQSEMPRNCGLSFRMDAGQLVGSDRRIGIAPLWATRGDTPYLAGLLTRLGGFDFTLIMENTSGAPLAHYRPGAFRFTLQSTRAEQIILLGWRAPHPFTTVDVDL